MAKKSMMGSVDGALGTVMWIVSILVSIAVGGLFLSGTTLGYPILELLPAIIHTVAGWIIVIGALLTLVLGIAKQAGLIK